VARILLPVVAATPLLPWASGCERLREKQALRAYAEKESRLARVRAGVTAMDPQLVQKVKGDGVKDLRTFLKESYLPLLRKWVSVLRSLPARTARLRRIRDAYLAELERSLEAHEGFADGLGSTHRAEAWARLQAARRRCAEARSRYRRELDAYYREHDLRRSQR
jgi:hypothetical protein